jgi:hypothetical protein
VPQTVVQPPRTSGAASGAAPSLVPSASTTVASMHATPLPRAPAPAYGFGGSLSLAQMTRPTVRAPLRAAHHSALSLQCPRRSARRIWTCSACAVPMLRRQ